MQNSMVKFTFSVFDGKYCFWVNFVPKLKIVCLKWNLVPNIAEFKGDFHFFVWGWKYPFLGKLGPKNQNCQFKLKCGTQNIFKYTEFNSHIHFFCFWPVIPFLGKLSYLYLIEYAEFNGRVHFFYFRQEIPFLSKFGPKNQNC